VNKLCDEISKVDWTQSNIEAFKSEDVFNELELGLTRIAQWAKQLETIYIDNKALSFIKEAQVSAQDLCCLVSLGFYKCSASSIRTILESVLYFSYFKDHPVELDSLLEVDGYYITKEDVISYNLQHTKHFKSRFDKLALRSDLNKIYSEISAIVHGQIPGKLHCSITIADKKYDYEYANYITNKFTETINFINIYLIFILSEQQWNDLDIQLKERFMKPISRPLRKQLNLV
jgi:hypothetical protein